MTLHGLDFWGVRHVLLLQHFVIPQKELAVTHVGNVIPIQWAFLMGWAHSCIPMVNKTDATPVKISDGSLFPFSSCDVVFGDSTVLVLWRCCLTSRIRLEGMTGMAFGISIVHYLRANGPNEVIGFVYRRVQARKRVR